MNHDPSKKKLLEFRKDTDGSILVFETTYLENGIRSATGDTAGQLVYSSAESLAKVVLCTRIREKAGKISHEIESFEIDPGKSQQSRKIWEELFSKHLEFAYLKKYLAGTPEYTARQGALQCGQASPARAIVAESSLDGATVPEEARSSTVAPSSPWEQLGWNCFDLAVGIPGGREGRRSIVEYALANAANEEFRRLLAPEISNAAILTAIHRNSKMAAGQQTHAVEADLARNALPASMQTDELIRLANNYINADERMRVAVIACNDTLGRVEGNSLSLAGLTEFFLAPSNQAQHQAAYLAFIAARDHIHTNELAFYDYCLREDIYKQYVNDYYGNNQWFALQHNAAADRQQTSMVDIVARKLGVVIVIYQNGAEIYRTTNVAASIQEITYDSEAAHFVAGRAGVAAATSRHANSPVIEMVSTSPSPAPIAASSQATQPFADLTEVKHRLNNPEIKGQGEEQTLLDLIRAEFICLSSNDKAMNRKITQSWWTDYSLGDVLRSYLGLNRADKTQVFIRPEVAVIRSDIFPFFNFNPIIKEYIIRAANQNCLARAAESEVVNRLGRGVPMAIGFKQEGAQTKLEFRKEPDGSVLVFETYCFPKGVNFMQGKNTTTVYSDESIATTTLVTRIREKDGHISHEIENFEIMPGQSPQSKAMLERLYKYEPKFAELKQYIVGTPEYVAKQQVLSGGREQDEWEAIDVGPDGTTIAGHHSVKVPVVTMINKPFAELKYISEALGHALKQKNETIKTIQEYIADQASQKIFGTAAMAEMTYKLHQAGRAWDGHNLVQQREFINNPDGSVSVVETVMLPKKIFDIDNDAMTYESDEHIATATLVTRIREKDGQISHEIESFKIIPGPSEQSKAILANLCQQPAFAELTQYIVVPTEPTPSETVVTRPPPLKAAESSSATLTILMQSLRSRSFPGAKSPTDDTDKPSGSSPRKKL